MGTIGAERIVVRDELEQSALSGVFPRSEKVTSAGWGLVRIDQRSARSSQALYDGAVVGTSINAGLRLDGPGMFPLHARFVVRPDYVYIERAADKADLWVDGVPAMRMALSNGSIVRLGDTLCLFVERELSTRCGTVEEHGGLLFGPKQLQWLSRAVSYAQCRQSFVVDGGCGAGKASLARLVLARARFGEEVVMLDARDTDASQQIQSAISHGASSWMVRHLDVLPRAAQLSLAHHLRRQAMPILVATLSRPLEAVVGDGQMTSLISSIIAGRRVTVPSLTDRRDDLPAIAQSIMSQIGCGQLPIAALEIIARSGWAKGVPQLRAALVQSFGQEECDVDTSIRTLAQLAPKSPVEEPMSTVLVDPDLARTRILKALDQANLTVATAARTLHMSRQTFYREVKRLHVDLNRVRVAS
jgi:predicted DNA-binding protein (UPF0251 family)